MITLRERKSRFMIAIKNANRQTKGTVGAIIERLKPLKQSVHSITLDNGVEFYAHEQLIAQLQLQTYFCDPYKSYQKGSIENGNGLLRTWLPREAPIDLISQAKIDRWATRLNQRPMKCLGYRTPAEVFFAERQALGV